MALKTAQGYIDLGDYDRADREFNKALNDDPYNTAARRGMEEAERNRMNYYDAAYDHTRSRMLRQVPRVGSLPFRRISKVVRLRISRPIPPPRTFVGRRRN